MLNSDQARQELEKLKRTDWIEARLAGLNRLPERLRPSARTLLGRDERGVEFEWMRQFEEQKKLFEFVPKLGALERGQLFESLLPGLGGAVERGWQLHHHLPFQTGYDRKPFRAPGYDETLIGRRLEWLVTLLSTIGPYVSSLPWLAAWAPHIAPYHQADALGTLFAAAIDAGGQEGGEVFEILCASARCEHEIGGMGRHVTRGLLCAARPEGWEVVEKLLLAAQREEGLRQVILETADEAHPEAFRRMLGLIRQHDLTRFSATVRAVNVWFGFGWDSVGTNVINKVIERVENFLSNPVARNLGVFDADAETAYLALWATAFADAVAVLPAARELLKHPKLEHRFVAAHLLGQIGLVGSQQHLMAALDDADLRVVAKALATLRTGAADELQTPALFAQLEQVVGRFPKREQTFDALVWPWCTFTLSRDFASVALAYNLGPLPPTRLIPHLDDIGSARVRVAALLGEQAQKDKATVEALLVLVGDTSRDVRQRALDGLAGCSITPSAALGLEKLLTRTAADVRRGVLGLLLRQPDAAALASADRLLVSKSAPQCHAGLELLREMVEAKRDVIKARQRAAEYGQARPEVDEFEQQQLAALGSAAAEKLTLEDGLGLLDHSQLTQAEVPQARNILLHSPTTARIVQSLDDLLWTNRETIIEVRRDDGQTSTELLANLRLSWPKAELSAEDDRCRFALAELCEAWWLNRGADLRDADGFELIRVAAYLESRLVWQHHEYKPATGVEAAVLTAVFGTDRTQRVRNQWLLGDVFRWLVRLHSPAARRPFVVAAFETCLARLIETGFHTRAQDPWRSLAEAEMWLGGSPDADCARRLWNCQLWLHHEGLRRQLYWPYYWLHMRSAYLAGVATDADVIYSLLAKRDARTGQAMGDFGQISQATQRRARTGQTGREVELEAVVRRIGDRIVEVELSRGDTPTIVSAAALQAHFVAGAEKLVRFLAALGKEKFSRNYDAGDVSRASVFSHLVFRCHPAETDTPERFAELAKVARITEKRLNELAVYAPQWASFAERSLGWPGLTEAVRWIHAHTKTGEWSWRDESKEFWHASLSQHTALTADDLVDGAVDVAWFHRMHTVLGSERWERLYDAAKYACTGAGHTRARVFADAMLGNVDFAEMTRHIQAKRHQDSVRALGLLPLPAGAGRDTEVLERYQVLQEFLRGSRDFGAQRRASEKRAAEIGLENLSRTAGYADPIRLQWAMEARAIEGFADGPVTVTVDDVTVSLGIDSWGDVELSALKDGKALADVPAKLRKHPDIVRLRERKLELKKQAARIRPSLEQLMVRGDTFTGAELRGLMEHPFLRPMLSNLVLVGDGVLGYPMHDGQVLADHAGRMEALKVDEKLRIAHPLDLLPAAQWHEWQRDCFARERIQPFKQVFRELYPLTESEKQEGNHSCRYAGHQVQPRQALALLGQRGWVHHPEEGVRKTFHDAGLTVWLEFGQSFYTPAEVEGLTVDSVHFSKRSGGECGAPLRLADLPPRLFSEAMRDLDLVVSVAHRGGVDPEASTSTLEMRATLVTEMCRLLRLDNVRVKDRYALVEGKFASYTVHLGSGVTRKLPGEALIIVPIHGHHRGRLFLPFADDDPRTAEVTSKVLLLARDAQVKDPNILDQIRGR